MERACQHLYPVEDQHEGTVVCSTCGLVLDQQLLQCTPTSSSPVLPPELGELCHRLHLPYALIEPSMEREWIQAPSRPDHVVPALLGTLYGILVDLGIPRSLHDLCESVRLPVDEVWPYVYPGTPRLTYPHQLVEQLLAPLNLPYPDLQRLKQRIQTRYDKLPFSPRTVVGAAAYLYLKDTPRHLSLVKLANLTGVSVMSMHRCKAHMTV